MESKKWKCIECEKVYEEDIELCPECGGVVLDILIADTWKDKIFNKIEIYITNDCRWYHPLGDNIILSKSGLKDERRISGKKLETIRKSIEEYNNK